MVDTGNLLHSYPLQRLVALLSPSKLHILTVFQVWAVMLRNSSEVFISQSTSRKFLDTVEELLTSPRTSPVVRERLLEVVAAAAYASGSSMSSIWKMIDNLIGVTEKDGQNDSQGFKGLWRRVKPVDKPEEVCSLFTN